MRSPAPERLTGSDRVNHDRDVPRTETPGRIVAHRGASRVAPENTLAAFRAAANQGVSWVEFDVSLLGDGTPVIHHDGRFGRCNSGTGTLAAAGLADLEGMDAGEWFGPDFAGERVPTLDACLDLLDEFGMSANLEMKAHADETGALASAVAHALARRDWAASRILVSSFSIEALRLFRDRAPHQPLAVLWEKPPADWQATVDDLGAASVHLDHRRLAMPFLDAARRHHVEVRVYTINDPDRMASFRDHGLTGVITDHPPLFLDRPDWAAWAAG